jgi:hypothetical protein
MLVKRLVDVDETIVGGIELGSKGSSGLGGSAASNLDLDAARILQHSMSMAWYKTEEVLTY